MRKFHSNDAGVVSINRSPDFPAQGPDMDQFQSCRLDPVRSLTVCRLVTGRTHLHFINQFMQEFFCWLFTAVFFISLSGFDQQVGQLKVFFG